MLAVVPVRNLLSALVILASEEQIIKDMLLQARQLLRMLEGPTILQALELLLPDFIHIDTLLAYKSLALDALDRVEHNAIAEHTNEVLDDFLIQVPAIHVISDVKL